MFQNVKWFALCAFSCIWVYSGDILETLKPSLKIHHHLSMVSKRRIYAPSVAATWVYVQRSWDIVAEQLGVVAHAVGRHNHMVVVGQKDASAWRYTRDLHVRTKLLLLLLVGVLA